MKTQGGRLCTHGPRPAMLWPVILILAWILGGCGEDGQEPRQAPPDRPQPEQSTGPAPSDPGRDSSRNGADARQAPLPSFAPLVREQGKAVVNISTTQRVRQEIPGLPPGHPFNDFFRRFGPPGVMPPEFERHSLGSGFIISADGYVLTNAHVVEDAEQVRVNLNDGREFEAKLVGSDLQTDIAVLKIEAQGLPTVVIGDPEELQVGDWVVAIGSPFGFDSTVTQGIVSAKGRALPQEIYVPFIQTDVAINPGNSGGPLFNLRGEVVAVNSMIYSASGGYMGVSFAIPIDLAMQVKDQLIEHGRVRRGRLGVIVQDLSPELAQAFGLERNQGALVSAVEPNGPAAGAGIQPGDVILSIDGRDLADGSELARAIGSLEPGSLTRLQVWRQGKARQVEVRVAELTPPQAQAPEAPAPESGRLGLVVRELSGEERRRLQTEGHLVVEQVAGNAARAGIQPGDVLLGVNNRPVRSQQELAAAVQEAGPRLALRIQRGETMLYVPVSLEEPRRDD